ncbi:MULTISPECIES: hypothetical protein [Devosia]|uniref:Uncharacterized protein n=1 Tax=Devosia equisanguinis TaxID=2490941 RepID=A0A3S4CBU5_9HYPH|nr:MULTISPECIES: hypothetical protein [Devosia]VDS04579.1 hypothetical protein DEVEQU_01718 [Devosia equisanguinis]
MQDRPLEWELAIAAIPRGWVISALALCSWLVTIAAAQTLAGLWTFVTG